MNRIEFDNLEIMEQLQYINDKVKNNTLRAICEKIGIGRTTVRDRLTKEGYIFDKDLKQYIKNNEYKCNTNILEVAATSTNKEVARGEYKSTTNIFNTKDNKNKILDILESHENIKEMLEWFNKQKNVIEVAPSELKINSDKLHGEVKITTVRLYNEVWERFKDFTSKHNEFKSMDLVSMALVEYIEKYDET